MYTRTRTYQATLVSTTTLYNNITCVFEREAVIISLIFGGNLSLHCLQTCTHMLHVQLGVWSQLGHGYCLMWVG